MLEPGGLLQQGRYEIIKPIKAGGMGAVYLAKAQHLSCTVALKESFYAYDDQLRKAFEREAKLLANLRHPALPRVIDHFVEDEGQFLVMDFVPGDDLEALIKQREGEPFPVPIVLEWAHQLLDALDYLHTHVLPILHRDIKPLNIKVTNDVRTGRDQVVLLDFGLAKGTPQQSRASGTSSVKSVMGYTPHFAPLEQMTGEGTDAASDLYSLAATLYYLMTGVEPADAMARTGQLLGGQIDPLLPANQVN